MAVQREQVVQTAEKYVSRGKIEPAIREYRKLLTDNPNDINTLNRIGDLYARIQRIDEAVDFFTQIAEQYSTEGFFVKAIAIYKKIIKLDPTRLEVYEKLAELYHRQGLVNEARTQYQVLADYYQKHDNAASAIAIYQKMADLEPNNPSYHVKLAEIYQSQQLIEKAMNEYRVIAEMMIAHGRAQDAAQVYERALDIDSSNLGFINNAVFKLKESGAASAASRFLAIATERNPAAARIGRLARMDEPAEPAPAPVAAAPRPLERAPEPPRYTPPPPLPPAPVEQEFEDVPYGGGFADQIWEEDALAAAVQAAETATALPSRSEIFPDSEPGPWAATPVAEPEEPREHEIELDLDEVFVLDMDGDDEPASLVKPPPDMLTGTGSRLGSAWKGGDDSDAAMGVKEQPSAPEPVLEEMEFDLGEVGSDLPPLQGLESFDMGGGLPPLSTDLNTGLDGSDTGEIVLELDDSDLPQIDSSSWAVELEPASGPPPAPVPARAPAGIDPDLLERTAAELQPENLARDEDLVSEAEVLAKYGLEEKAMERLREALRLQPRNLNAYAAMVQIHLDKGRHDSVVELANTMSRTAAEIRDAQVWPKTRRQLIEAGYRLDGDRVVADPHARIEEPAPAPLPAPVQEVEEDRFSHLPDIDIELPELEAMAPEPPVREEPAPAPPPPVVPPPAAQRKRSSVEIDQVLRGLLDPKPKRPAAARPATPAPAAPAIPVNQAPPPPQAAPEPPAPPPPTAGPMIFNPLEIGAMIESEDFDWEPPSASLSGSPSAFASPPPPPPVSGQALPQNLDDTGGLSWLDEADRNRPGKSAAGTAANTAANTDRLFDDEDDFFDLAAELEQELSEEDLFKAGEMPAQQAEQSLEEIVEGFKKGVSEHLSPTDYDTHFNLGIAYREMGLLDEAIGEFQVAAKDAGHLVLCCSMLGLCFLDKGLPELAVKWYKRGLESPGLAEEDNLGLLYDLGCAYLVVDDKASAYKAFVDLYGINNGYRDVVARIEELGR